MNRKFSERHGYQMADGQKTEIAGIGACVADTLMIVPDYPAEDTKLRALESRTAGGGPAATGIVAAGRLGAAVGFIGVLSDDGGGRFLLQDFKRYGVNTDCVEIRPGYRSFTSVIWISARTASRTCVFDRGTLPPLKLQDGSRKAVASAKLLMIDGNEIAAAEEACRIARENGTKVLYDCGGLYEGVERLLIRTDIMIPSEEFALGHTGCGNIEDAAKRLYKRYRPEIVVVTAGSRGGILYDGKTSERYPAFPVEAADTNGAGDVFHGAFAAGLVKGFSYRGCCIFASAASALKCTGIGARESVPDPETVRSFLKERGYGDEILTGR
ncbi:MAG: PfkB family carbohydrate kinase [bacterium]|nr:PfkB family carbohydrate kinase [bacterium]